ncbi:superoxide dismutase [Aquimarina sp. I32.4]|uniref:superoxide dismutase n=1 Tax=Aquimarina sp. I32.4 TaxID=2053903 RepID=UPI000CDF000B|nr:superoxide dismutase [Aquimarina sp. I32.4]
MDKRKFLKIGSVAVGGTLAAPSLWLSSCNKKTTPAKVEEEVKKPLVTETLFTLPDLPYAFDALEPIIDKDTMQIHYSKHHQGYVNKLNKALSKLSIEKKPIEDLLAGENLPEAIQNNGGGHYNHTLFWESLSPEKKTPSKELVARIEKDLGAFEDFKKSMITQGLSVFGSGWVWLIQTEKGLQITTTENQDNPLMSVATQKGNPILGIDVWEHAYYLKYQNKRKEYLTNIMDIINWEVVEKRIA